MSGKPLHISWFEQVMADVPADEHWLSAAERERLAGFRIPKRRQDWLLGRWTAKRTVAALLDLNDTAAELCRIEIRADGSGAPEAFVHSDRAPVSISLSHSSGVSVCAAANWCELLGCDVEAVESHSAVFIADYFTERERALIEDASDADRLWLVPLIWSAKESALKALKTGLRADTRSVEFVPQEIVVPDGWAEFSIRCAEGQILFGWAMRSAKFVRTVVTARKSLVPARMPSLAIAAQS